MKWYLLATCLLLTACGSKQGEATPLFQEPHALLSDAGFNLIVYYEVGDEGYYNKTERFPTWPGGQSGVTIACGVDCGYETADRITSDWSSRIDAEAANRLAQVAGITGQKARSILRSVRDIEVTWPIALDEFREIEVANEYALTIRTYPGADNLRSNAISALVATTYNRGSALSGDSRVDLRVIRSLVPRKDYEGMADALRHIPTTMYDAWSDAGIYNGLKARYDATAALMETP
jgi:hypothetical protein